MDGDMTAWLAALTDFGDVAVLIPVVGAMLIWLLLVFSRAALRWMLAVSVCVGFTALLKVAFYGCPPAGHIYSPSGHTSLSTLVYGALSLVTATAGPGHAHRNPEGRAPHNRRSPQILGWHASQAVRFRLPSNTD